MPRTVVTGAAGFIGSHLSETLINRGLCAVNSRHHQSVDRIGQGLVATAAAPDGVIEAVEAPAARFCVGVQWHPENFRATGEFKPLFDAFVESARRSLESRSALSEAFE